MTKSAIAAPLIVIGAILTGVVNAATEYELSYSVGKPLNWLIPKGASSCTLTLVIEGGKELDYEIEKSDSGYTGLLITLPVSNNNYKIKTKNDSKFFGSRCDFVSEKTLNQLILEQWKEKYSENYQCVIDALQFDNFMSEDKAVSSSQVYPLLSNSGSERALNACKKISELKLSSNVECEYPSPIGKTRCDEGYSTNKDKNRKLSFKEAVRASLSGDEVVIRLWENALGKSNRYERESRQSKMEQGWTKVKSGDDGLDGKVKYDMYLREVAGYSNLRELSHLTNWEAMGSGRFKSRILKILMNCQSGKYNIAQTKYYSENFGEGKVVKSENSIDILEISNSGIKEEYLKICKVPPTLISTDLRGEWDQLLKEAKEQEKIAAQEVENKRRSDQQSKKIYGIADSRCKPAIYERFQTFGTNRYGVVDGRKVTNVIKAVTYDSNTTKMMGYGKNYLSIYTVVTENYSKGYPSGGSSLTVKCVLGDGGEVLGLEVDYR